VGTVTMKNWLIILLTFLVLVLGSSYVAWEHTPVVSAQGQQGTTVVGTCDCSGFKVTATKLSPAVVPAGSCGYQLAISQTYPSGGHVPKGIRLTASAPVTFANVTPGAMVSAGFTQTPAIIPPASATVKWYGGTWNSGSSGVLANIILNPNGVSPQHILVEWLDEDGIVMCHATLDLDCPCRNASTAIAANQNLCLGQTTTVTLNPLPQAGSLVTWYKANAPCPAAIPASGTPTTGWQVTQIGGNTDNTNVLPQSTCYQAVITEGPNCTYTSSVTTVNVAQVANLGNVNPQPLCKSGTNTFTITDPYLVAHPNLITWWGPPGSTTVASGVITYTTPTLTATAATDCPSHIYNYGVTIANSGCGPQTRNLPITVFHESDAGILTANPAGPLCYDQATRIHAAPVCGQVTQWQQSTVGALGPWTALPGAGTTTDYWTPELLQTTWYQVTVANGICLAKTSVIKVEVKPKLAVTLTSNGTVLCNTPITLTATPPIGYPPPLFYTWYRNGVVIAGPSASNTFSPVTQPGNYRVVINDPACGAAKSLVVRIYPKPTIVITGPCGICQGKTITLKATVIGGDPACSYTYNWSAPGFTGTGQTVNVSPNLPAGGQITYTVTTSCAGCTVSAQHTVMRCPP